MVRRYEQMKSAIALRKTGKSYSEISKILGGIPKGSLSYWLSDIPLSLNQRTKLQKSTLRKLVQARKKSVAVRRQRRNEYFQNIYFQHQALSTWLKKKEPALLVLATLYLAEGGKTQRGALSFGNSDPGVIRLFLQLLRFCYKIDESKFRCTVQGRADQDFTKLERFWSVTTRIQKSQFYKARVDPRSKGERTKKVHYKGVCRIDYFSAPVFHDLMIIGEILTEN